MSKIHITLVGGQPAPVYHGIVATKPDLVVYVYSKDTYSKQAFKILKKEVSIKWLGYKLHPTNPILIKNLAEKLAHIFKENEEITVNISGGLKSWSYWFGIVFEKCPNATIIYIDQNNLLWNYRTMKSYSNVIFDMQTLFRLYRNPLTNYIPFTDYTEADFNAIPLIEECRAFNNQDFNRLLTILNKDSQTRLRMQECGEFRLSNSLSYVKWKRNNHIGNSTVSIHIQNNDSFITKEFTSPHAIELAFFAGWFECKVALLLSKWNKAKEISMNCHFPFKPGFDKNEVDIIINTGIKILFVECKTQISKTIDIDKFRSVIKAYGGTASKGLFITDAPMYDLAKAKCDEHNILTFSLQNDHGNLNCEEALITLLNTELDKINAR